MAPYAGEPSVGTPAELMQGLRENPSLMTETHYPHAGYTFNVGYDAEEGTYTCRVYDFGTDPDNEANIQVQEDGLTEEDIVFRFGVLDQREQMAQDPMAALMQMLMSGGLDLGEDED